MPAKTAKQFAKIVTANDLFEGDAIYLTRRRTWSRDHADAALATSAEDAEALLAVARGEALTVVGPYLADAAAGADGRPVPVHFREVFRTRGPSNRFHGKQADAELREAA